MNKKTLPENYKETYEKVSLIPQMLDDSEAIYFGDLNAGHKKNKNR